MEKRETSPPIVYPLLHLETMAMNSDEKGEVDDVDDDTLSCTLNG